MLAGQVSGEPVLVARRGEEVFAIGATCTHWSGPLAEGLVVDDTVRCPWHHACFSLRTGEALRAPALKPVPRYAVEVKNGIATVGAAITPDDGATPHSSASRPSSMPESVVIIGGGGAGEAAAEMLRRGGFEGSLTMVTADADGPYDRPNLSKDYLAGNAQEEWIPLRDAEFYSSHRIELLLGTRATAVDAAARTVTLSDGRQLSYDRLLLATGSEPVRLDMPGANLPHVHYLRTFADSKSIIAAAQSAQHAVVIGASFIGLEVAASLRARGLSVHVVAPESLPLERVMGREIGEYIRSVHEKHGVVFRLGLTASSIASDTVTLTNGESISADLVVIGIGVRPQTSLAQDAGAAVDNGVLVNEYLETSVPGIYAAGDIARYPDPRTGDRIRVEHWVVAERQAQTAARYMLVARERYDLVPFFLSTHFDTSITYIGHARKWDEVAIDGDIMAGDATVRFREGGKTLAIATIGRDKRNLELEVEMERGSLR
jgi:NADPH-dependent 2,4-dienoyl-CoA reductase/sulfur reductase-like enzyme/nitrite reductase/ring-hydroxylating ferredoxin subunit